MVHVAGHSNSQSVRRRPDNHCFFCPSGRSDQPTGRLALVFELMECNIYELIKGRTTYLKVRGLQTALQLQQLPVAAQPQVSGLQL